MATIKIDGMFKSNFAILKKSTYNFLNELILTRRGIHQNAPADSRNILENVSKGPINFVRDQLWEERVTQQFGTLDGGGCLLEIVYHGDLQNICCMLHSGRKITFLLVLKRAKTNCVVRNDVIDASSRIKGHEWNHATNC